MGQLSAVTEGSTISLGLVITILGAVFATLGLAGRAVWHLSKIDATLEGLIESNEKDHAHFAERYHSHSTFLQSHEGRLIRAETQLSSMECHERRIAKVENKLGTT